MAVVITSTTSSQADMDHAVSENWREAPPETPEPVPAPASAPEVPAEPETEEPEVKEPEEKALPAKAKEHKSGWQKRIDKLTARNHQIETEAAKLREEIAQYKAAQAAKPEEAVAKQPEAPREPKRSDFKEGDEGLAEFLATRDAWKDAKEQSEAQNEQRKAIADEYNKRASEARGRYEDWDEVVSSADIIVPTGAIEAIKEADNGPDVAYYLAKHPEEAQQLSEVTPLRAIAIVNRISDRLAAEQQAAEKAPPKPKAKALAPITPVGNSATRNSTMEELPLKEWMKIRNKQEREQRRGY